MLCFGSPTMNTRRRTLPAGAAAGAGIGRQPGVQRVPLQRAGVLELVDQHVADARVQPLLHPARRAWRRAAAPARRARGRSCRPGRARACRRRTRPAARATAAPCAQVLEVRVVLVRHARRCASSARCVAARPSTSPSLRGASVLGEQRRPARRRSAPARRRRRAPAASAPPASRARLPPPRASALGQPRAGRRASAALAELGLRRRRALGVRPARRCLSSAPARSASSSSTRRASTASSHLPAWLRPRRGDQRRVVARAAPASRSSAAWKRRSTSLRWSSSVLRSARLRGSRPSSSSSSQRRGAQQLREPGVEGADLDRAAGIEHAVAAAPPARRRAARACAAGTPRSRSACCALGSPAARARRTRAATRRAARASRRPPCA